MPELSQVVREIAYEMAERPDRGDVASYIPELARSRTKGAARV